MVAVSNPTTDPTIHPTIQPTNNPTFLPTNSPTSAPTKQPTNPTKQPTNPTKSSIFSPTMPSSVADNNNALFDIVIIKMKIIFIHLLVGLLHHMMRNLMHQNMIYMVFNGSSSGSGGLGGDAVPDSNAQQRGTVCLYLFSLKKKKLINII
ncbi:MAG: hypothetical protein GY755_10590 [Chloroflexi bacterium]|nr:hypothetical protein [Chloroflexota bacterium]